MLWISLRRFTNVHCIVGYESIDNFAATLSAARKPAQVRLEKTFLRKRHANRRIDIVLIIRP